MDIGLDRLTSWADNCKRAGHWRTAEKKIYGEEDRKSKPHTIAGGKDDNDVQLISELTSANLGGYLMSKFKALTKLIRTKLKTADHQAGCSSPLLPASERPLEFGRFTDLKIDSHKIGDDDYRVCDRVRLADRQTDDRMINGTVTSSRPTGSRPLLTGWMLIALVLNLLSNNRIYAKPSSDDSGSSSSSNQQPAALYFSNNLPAKVAFYNTTGTVLNCPISGAQKPTIHWLAVGAHHSSLNALNNLNGLGGKASYRYSNSFSYVNQHWPIGGHYRNHYQQPTGGNLPTANANLIENVLASNPELSSVVDQHSVIYTRSDGALVFPPFYANDLQPNVHNRKYRCLAINEHGALLSNEIQIKALIYQPYEVRVYDEFVVRDSVGVLRCQVPAFILDYITINCWIRNDGLIIRKSSNEDSNSRYLMFDTGELHLKQVVKEDEKYSFRCEITDQLIGQTLISSTSGHFVITESSNSMAPRFIHRKTKVRSAVASTVHLPCAVQASPKAKINWFNETTSPLASSNNLDLTRSRVLQDGTLVINNLALTDTGSYKCLTSNRLGEEATLVQLQVTAPLSVTINGGNGKSVSSAIGAALLLNCTVRGQPNQVAWYRNGVRINPGRTISTSNNLLADTADLIIHEPTSSLLANKFKLIDGTSLLVNSIETGDSGAYQCIASRDSDQAQASIQVHIISKFPVLIKVPANVSVDQNGQVSLHCAAQGTPIPQILWSSYGDETLQEKSNIRIGDFVSSDGAVHSFVNLTQLDAQDAGLYTCSARNFLGTQSASAFISVKAAAPYVKTIRNLTALAGGAFFIQCPYSAYGPVTLNWFKGKKRLPLNRRQTVFVNGTLLVENLVREEDEGEYRCEVRDEQGRSAERSMFVRILIKPSIMPFSFAPNLQEGMRASITCTVTTGDPPVSLSWLHNGRPLKNGQDQSISVVSRGANGQHHEDHNSVISLPFQSNEAAARDVVIEQVDEFISTLIFRPLRQEHSGQYACLASNQASKVNYTVTLSVDAPPKWIIEPTDRTGVVGDSIQMHCMANGKPLPTVIWKKLSQTNANGYLDLDKKSKELELAHNSNYKTLISGSRVQTLVNGTLYILEVVKEDAGFYLCEASNGIGSTLSTVVRLTIHTPAHFKERYQQMKVLRNEPVQLVCNAFGEFPLKVSWAKEGKGPITASSEHHSTLISTDPEGRRLNEIPNARIVEELVDDRLTSKLIMNSVQRESTGLYLCTAENAFNADRRKDERHIELLVQDSPDPVESLKLVKLSSKAFQISWSSPFDGNSPIKRYLLQYKTSQDNWQSSKESSLEASRTEAFVRNLTPVTDYEVRMATVNDIGQSRWSNLLTITTEEEVPESAPAFVHVTATGSRRLKVVFQSGKTSKGASITGYYIGYKVANSPSYIFKTVKLQSLMKEDEKTNGKLAYELSNLEKQTKYAIVVQAFNVKGAGPLSSEAICQTLEFDAPNAPEVELDSVQFNSVTIAWQQNDNDNPVFGYIIKFKRKTSTSSKIPIADYLAFPLEQRTTNNSTTSKSSNGASDSDSNLSQSEKQTDDATDSSWLETQIMNTEQTKFTINNLKCGSFYLIKVCAFNSMGRGADSDVLQVKTKGSKPQIPDKEQLFVLNSSYLQLNLFVFSNFEHVEHCPIEYLNVKYKPSNEETWTNWLLSSQDQYLNGQSINSNQPVRNNLLLDTASNEQNSNLVSNLVPNLAAGNGEFLTYHNKNNFPETCIINNLSPASWFNVWLTVRNSAGASDAIYKIATLTENGEYLQQQSGTKAMLWMPFLGSISLLCVLILTAVVILYIHHRSNSVAQIQYSTASIDPKSNECLALGQLSIDSKSYLNSNGTYVDNCSNFATSSCSTGMHANAYQTPNCTGDLLQQNTAANIANNLLLKNSGIYGNNYTTCTNLLSMRPGSNHNLVDDVYANGYLPSPYAATRIQLPANGGALDSETSLKLDHQQQQMLMEKKSFSNIYDIPQANQQCHGAKQLQANQNRNNSISIGELVQSSFNCMDAFVENKPEDLSELYSTSAKNRRAISQVDLLWNSQLSTYQHQQQQQQQLQSSSNGNCQKTLSTFRN